MNIIAFLEVLEYGGSESVKKNWGQKIFFQLGLTLMAIAPQCYIHISF